VLTPWSDCVEVYWAGGAEAYVTPVADDCVGVAILTSRKGRFDEVFFVERESRAGYGVAGGPSVADHPVSLPLRDTGAVLATELDRLGGDEVFEQALLAATG